MRLPRFITSAFEKNARATAVRKTADPDDALEQFRIGLRYELGDGRQQDDVQAAFWLRKAAEQGLAPAQDSLAEMYACGRGVPQDSAQATAWWHKAAEQGYAPAQGNLGNAYESGDSNGVPQDNAEAYFWYSLAVASFMLTNCREEAALCREQRDDVAALLTPAERTNVRRRIRKWAEEHPSKPKSG